MKTKFSLNKFLPHLDEKLQKRIKKLAKDSGKDIEELELERKSFACEKATLKEGERAAIKYVSTRTVDKMGDIVVPRGMILSDYKKGGMPVFWGHRIDEPPIGSDEWIKTDQWGIKCKTIYADTGSESNLSNIVWNLVQQGHQKQSSVGFIPLEWAIRGEKEFEAIDKELVKVWPEYSKGRKSVRRIITKGILLEHSDVGIGMNDDTSVLAVSKAWKDAGATEEMLNKLGIGDEDTIEEGLVLANKSEGPDEEDEDDEDEDEDFDGTEELDDEELEKKLKEADELSAKAKKIEDEIEGEIEKKAEKFTRVALKPKYLKVIQKPMVDVKAIAEREVRRLRGKLT